MSSNPILKAIQERRSIFRFKPEDVDEDKINAIIEAARWAPSWINTQPWSIIVVKDKEIKSQLTKLAGTVTGIGIEEAPVIFVVTADAEKDPHHFIEDASAATQNMSLAAHSLDLASFWIGIFDYSGERGSSEDKIKELLNIPENHRVVSLLPVGVANMKSTKERKQASEFVYREKFSD